MEKSIVLKDFGKLIGIELDFDENNQCLLNVCGNVWISIYHTENNYVLYGMLGDFPEQEQSEFWKSVLSVNKDLLDLEEGSICLEESTDSLLLIKSITTNALDAFVFKEKF